MMRISDICFEQLKRFEGLRNEAYYDPGGVLTIGYGHTGPDVRPGDVISKYWAEHLLKADLYDVEKAVDELKVAVTQPQFDALVSFAFNLGIYKLKTSTLLKTIRHGGSMHEIKAEFKKWVYAGGQKLRGLEQRREWEARRFFDPDELEPMKRRDWSDFHKVTQNRWSSENKGKSRLNFVESRQRKTEVKSQKSQNQRSTAEGKVKSQKQACEMAAKVCGLFYKSEEVKRR